MLLQTGQTIFVYKDPITCVRTEGIATLIKRINSGQITGCETWSVKFHSDNVQVYRHVNVKNH